MPNMYDVRTWPFYPIEIPLTSEGMGPATIGKDADKIVYEVWDRFHMTISVHDNLPDAINRAFELSFPT